MPSRETLELEIESIGQMVRVRALGSQGESSDFHELGTLEQLSAFEKKVRQAAADQQKLGEHLHQAHELYQALFQGGVRDLLQRKHGAAGGEPLLLRLSIKGARSLQAFPWEALCERERTLEFLGNDTDVLLARSVSSLDTYPPRSVWGPVRVLAVSPSSDADRSILRVALEPDIAAGEVEWLPALRGEQARWSRLMARLDEGPVPHILHFIGHGRLNAQGEPELLFAPEEDGEEGWIQVNTLAPLLTESCRKQLRLIVLEACLGAQPGGALASAAELLVLRGAHAVIAHLWEVHADVARRCSTEFYRLLTGANEPRGDVARSLNHARMKVFARFNESAEAFSPVLYLRGQEPALFDFMGRRLTVPRPAAPPTHSARLKEFLAKPSFSLVLGDRWRDEQKVREDFRKQLGRELARPMRLDPSKLSMSALAQRYAQHYGEESLYHEFQEFFRNEVLRRAADSLPILVEPARHAPSGIHLTLMRMPILEFALAEYQPQVTLNVIQPLLKPLGKVKVMQREGGQRSWRRLDTLDAIDMRSEITVLRLYRGYMPDETLIGPLLTEDDYLQHINRMRVLQLVPESDSEPKPESEFVHEMLRRLRNQPALLMGLSMMTWHHRMLLYWLFGERPLPNKSLVVLEPGEKEQDVWERSRLFPEEDSEVDILELEAGDSAPPSFPPQPEAP
jgi:CHAT domain-containing protein